MKAKRVLYLLASFIFILTMSTGSLTFAAEQNEVSAVENLANVNEEFVFNSVEDDEFITSTVTNLKGELVTELIINKGTNEVAIDGVLLPEEDQEALVNLTNILNENSPGFEPTIQCSDIQTFSADACTYKSIGTYDGSTKVPSIGVAAFAAFLSTVTKAPYSGYYAVASVVVGSLPTLYYTLNDAQCYSENYLHNRRTVKFYEDSKHTKQIGDALVSYQKKAD